MTKTRSSIRRTTARPSDGSRPNEIVRLRQEVKRLRQRLDLLTPDLSTLLRRRGFRIFKQEPFDDVLLPGRKHVPSYYRMLHKYSFRLFLRDVIKFQTGFTSGDVARYATSAVAKEYIEYLLSLKLIKRSAASYSLAKGSIRSFGPTLEWFIAELLRREFAAEVAWGVKFRRTRAGGDYDVLAKLDGSLLYIEVKSSPPKQIYDSEVAAFLDRVEDLAPEAAVFFMDTELRMKDKLVPLFEA